MTVKNEYTYERLFVGALIGANKYLKDPRVVDLDCIVHGNFSNRAVQQVELQFLDAINCQLAFGEDELASLWDSLQWIMDFEERERREYKEAMRARREREERERMQHWADTQAGGYAPWRDTRDRRGKSRKGKFERKRRNKRN